MNWIETPCEQIDAAVFTGDCLEFDEQRAMLENYIGRWTRAIAEWVKTNVDEAAPRVILRAAELRAKAVRDEIAALLAECTDSQRARLNQIHDSAPWKGLANLPDNKVDETYELVRRTVIENEKKINAAIAAATESAS